MENYYRVPEFKKLTKKDKLFQAKSETDAYRKAEAEVMDNVSLAVQACVDIRRIVRARLLSAGVQLIDDNAEIEEEIRKREMEDYVLGTA
jgi:hypothetical protein